MQTSDSLFDVDSLAVSPLPKNLTLKTHRVCPSQTRLTVGQRRWIGTIVNDHLMDFPIDEVCRDPRLQKLKCNEIWCDKKKKNDSLHLVQPHRADEDIMLRAECLLTGSFALAHACISSVLQATESAGGC